MTRNAFLAAIFVEVFLVIVGLVSIIWPETIRDFALSHDSLFFYNPFKAWMRGRAYLVSLRIGGVVAILCSALVAISIFRGMGFK